MALNAVMERDSENPTPTLDKEPKKAPLQERKKSRFLLMIPFLIEIFYFSVGFP